MATNDGRRWTMDDAWWLDPPMVDEGELPRLQDGEAVEAGESGESRTLWADDTGAWEDEPLTSPGVGDDGDQDGRPPAPVPGKEAAGATRGEDQEIDPLWAYF
jgi:hypothetical protein